MMEYIQSALADPETLTRFLEAVTGETVRLADDAKIEVADDLAALTNCPDVQITNGKDHYMIYIGRCGIGRTVCQELQFYEARAGWWADGRVRIILIDDDADGVDPWMMVPARVVGGAVDRVVDSGLTCYVLPAGCEVIKALHGGARSVRPKRKQCLRRDIAELEAGGWSYSDAIFAAIGVSRQWTQGYQEGLSGKSWKEGNEK